MSQASELTPVARARELILERCRPLGAETVPLAEAGGRVLAAAVRAAERVPGFDNSAMDGFAFRADDLADGPGLLRLAGESSAGHPYAGTVGAGEAIAISTGAVLPEGADTVVRLEDTSEPEEGCVAVIVVPERGANVRRAGDDIEPGAELLPAGARLGAAELGVLASVGVAEPGCALRPRVALLSTGDELVGPGDPLRPGGVRNSNALALPALVEATGALTTLNGRAPDEEEATRAAIAAGLEAADLLVVCGGISVGPHDHVKDAFAACGLEEVFWRVSLKPGKPAWFGTTGAAPDGGTKLALGLPGNPVSAFVTFLLFARPALLAFQGADAGAARVTATLTAAYEKPADRAHAIRVRLQLGPSGWLATPAPHQGSHVMTSLLAADGLALIDEETTHVEEGEPVTVELIPGAGPI